MDKEVRISKTISRMTFSLKSEFVLCLIPVVFLAWSALYKGGLSSETVTLHVFGFTVYCILSIRLYKRIRSNLNKVLNLARTLSDSNWGELAQIEREDEFGTLLKELNKVSERVKLTFDKQFEAVQHAEDISKIQAGHTTKLANGYEHMVALFEQLTAGSNEQISGMKNVNKQLEIMYTASQKIDSSTKEVLDLAIKAKHISEEGSKTVSSAKQEMEKVLTVSQMVNDSILTLAHEAEKIEEIVQLINDITRQTNVLAINAAIEAARAGSHGQGFSVVSEEVRKLADNTLSSANKIMKLVGNVKNLIDNSVKNMGQGMEQVNQSKNVIETAGEAISNLDAIIHTTSCKVEANKHKARSILEQTQELWDIQEGTTSIATGFLEAASQEANRMQEQMYYTREVVAKSDELVSQLKNLKKSCYIDIEKNSQSSNYGYRRIE